MCVYMLGDTRATPDELFAAAAAFILLALGWASAFWCIEYLGPGSFVSAHPVLPERRTWFELLYLSMTTLSTTGFGDIVPVSSAARAAVILEQFAGVLYVALLIARLAGFASRGPARPDRLRPRDPRCGSR
jgi:Ion channel